VQSRAMDPTVLWSTMTGIRCVMLPYDESRVQLKLMRQEGTIKADLFQGNRAALDAAREWLDQLNAGRGKSS
jgi:hypothetical protein